MLACRGCPHPELQLRVWHDETPKLEHLPPERRAEKKKIAQVNMEVKSYKIIKISNIMRALQCNVAGLVAESAFILYILRVGVARRKLEPRT